VLVGGGADEAPEVYKRLPDVLAAHGDTIRVKHTLRPLGVAMAGREVYDPHKAEGRVSGPQSSMDLGPRHIGATILRASHEHVGNAVRAGRDGRGANRVSDETAASTQNPDRPARRRPANLAGHPPCGD
jgi:hypothetical protein